MSGTKCFLIDDDPDDREIFQFALDELNGNFQLMSAGNGIEAIKHLSNHEYKPDHIFIDVNMPLMSGMDCLIAIKKIEHLKDTPVYMYTTSSEFSNKEKFLGNGALQIITKPNKISELIQLLTGLLK